MRLSSRAARRALTLATLAAIGVLWSGCTAKEQSEYVTGISTQMNVPRDLRAIRVSVSVGGFRQFCRGYRVHDGKVLLPRSLGVHALNNPEQSGPVTFGIVGYDKQLGDGTEFADEECDVTKTSDADGQKRGIRLLRRSRQPYVKDEVLFLPMPLKYACMDVDDCGPSKTCKAGRCVEADTDPATLPRFHPDLVDGNGGACFSITQCFAAAAPAIPVDASICLYAVANSKDEPPLLPGAPDPVGGPASGDGVNVAITWDGGYVQEVLDKEDKEGFFIPNPAKPQQFQLTAGLCDMVKGYPIPDPLDPNKTIIPAHRITAVRASGTCQAKSPFQPICAGDQFAAMGADKNGNAADTAEGCKAIELRPPKSLLTLVIDNTVKHKKFFEDAPEATFEVPLADPAFDQTDVALFYSPGGGTACGAGAPSLSPKLARQAKTDVINLFKQGPTAGDVDFALDGALERAYAHAKNGDYFRRAVLVIGNRDFTKDACPNPNETAVQQAQKALSADPSKPIKTYVFLLAQPPDGVDAAQTLADANGIAAAGGTGAATEARGQSNKANAFTSFQTIVKSLATCVYEIPTIGEKPEAGKHVFTYTDPLLGFTKRIDHDPACTSDGGAGSGWGTDGKKIFVCGQACEAYRDVLATAGAFNAGFQKAAPPVPLFAHRTQCAPKPTP
jgi:hypothetical protein